MMLDTLIATLQEKRADLGNVNVHIEIVNDGSADNSDFWQAEIATIDTRNDRASEKDILAITGRVE